MTELDQTELITMIEVLLSTNLQLGGSKTYGSGFIEIKNILYQDIKQMVTLNEDGTINREDKM